MNDIFSIIGSWSPWLLFGLALVALSMVASLFRNLTAIFRGHPERSCACPQCGDLVIFNAKSRSYRERARDARTARIRKESQ